MQAIRFHYRPVRYLFTRFAAARRSALALGPTGCVTFDEVEPPALPGSEWVRVRSTMSGICGSDLAAITANDSFTLEPFGAFPFTFGHENVGVVEMVGPEVSGISAGERVIVNPMLSCRQRGLQPQCAACARGEYGLCRRTRDGSIGTGPMIGYSPAAGGGWSQYFVAHHTQLHRAGELSDDVAVLTDPFASSLRPVLLHPPAEDDDVLVIGAGTIGILTVKALRLIGYGADITVLARYDFQLEMAEHAGATRVFRSAGELYKWAGTRPGAVAYKPTLAARFVEGGPSLVYDTVGSERSIADALALTREGGRVILVGAAARVTADWTRVWYRQLSIAGVFAYGQAPYENANRDIYEVSIELLRGGNLGELNMVTHAYPLEEYRAALSTALDKNGHRSVKVVFRPGD